MTESQLLEDIGIMEKELIQCNDNEEHSDKDTPKSNNSYHKLPSLESIVVYVLFYFGISIYILCCMYCV